MRGKTNILPMVGGYINAPVENYIAGENLQLGDLVQKSYTGQEVQIYKTLRTDLRHYCIKPHKLYDGKLALYSNGNSSADSANFYATLIDVQINDVVENKVSLCSNISHSGYFFCPIDNRTVLLFYNHGSDIGCKKIVYNEGEFTVTDITVTGSINAAYFTNSEYAWNWEYGNGGTLVKSNYGFIYVTLSNDVANTACVNIDSQYHNGQFTKILYIEDYDYFLVNYGNLVSTKKVVYSNGTLTVNTITCPTIYYPEKFGDYILAKIIENGYIKLAVCSVSDDEIELESVIQTDITGSTSNYGAMSLFCSEDIFAFIHRVSGSSVSTKFSLKSYAFNEGIVLGDTTELNVSTSASQGYYSEFVKVGTGYLIFNYTPAESGYAYCCYQEMNGINFADDSVPKMVKAVGRIEGVVKRGGNANESVEVFVLQASS